LERLLHVDRSKSQPSDDELSLKGVWSLLPMTLGDPYAR